ncbi:MAG: ATP-binding cassette domain-containing protein [Holosporales bacterium]|jgi:ABC-2 type transport system ATP-binding protein|nr:ATP-binding cassette domain-containing protein [Holosporales bacterium]
MIKISNLTKTFNKGNLKALDNISCSIPRNKIVGFIGPDGAGKTTLLRIIAGIMKKDCGDISFFGKNNPNPEEVHKIISYMPQKFGLYEDLSIIENLDLYAELKGLSRTEREKSFKNVLSATRLLDFRDRLVGNLSGGMKQKLGLACSLLKTPKVLILDEPSVGVDPMSRRELISMVYSMLEHDDTTVLWSTAYLDEAQNLDHVILLSNGSIVFEGSPKEAIKTVEGRVFVIKDAGENRRHIASNLLKEEFVVDSIVLGSNVRFVVTKGNSETIHPIIGNSKPGEATFEDACIDMLGGFKEKSSPIEQYLQDLPFDGKNTEDIVVEVSNLTKKFGDFTAADNISFSLKRGKILGLLGPNGSGKSTTFKMLCGLLPETSGTARIAGTLISDIKSNAKMKLGYMAQKFSLYSILSVKQNLEFFAGAYRLSGSDRKYTVEKMLDIFHLRQFSNFSARTLSLGYKQRLALACSIMHKPEILFLDEPTSGVDPITRKEFWMHINCMVRHGVSVIITTHFMDEAENCDDIALIYKGKIRATGSPDELKIMQFGDKNRTLEETFIKVIEQVDNSER